MVTASQESFRGSSNTSLSSQSKSGKGLRGWPKKRPKANPLQNSIVQPVAPTADEKLAALEIQNMKPERNDREPKEYRWAAIWLRRLQGRKKRPKNDLNSPPKILTLAEQLREAQMTTLCTPDSRRLSTIAVLKNPSRAKKFFQKLSRSSPPSNISVEMFPDSSESRSTTASPPEYSKISENEIRLASNRQQGHQYPDFEELERQIEQLAQELERVKAHRTCSKCNEPLVEDHKPILRQLPSSRPSPSMEQVSFFAYWWGYEIAIPKTKMKGLQGAKEAVDVFMEFISLLAPPQLRLLKPLVNLILDYLSTNYKIALLQDNGNGVILAATWLVPLLIIPRAWDYPNGSNTISRCHSNLVCG